MRVIAGTLRGRRLKAPDWEGLRPTSDRLRETLRPDDVVLVKASRAVGLEGVAPALAKVAEPWSES